MTDALAIEPHTAPPPRSAGDIASDAQAVVHNLRERLVALDRDLASTPARRESLALKAALGNRKAKTALNELAIAETRARRERDDLDCALKEARRLLEDSRADERAERDEASLAEAQALASQFIEASARIDKSLRDIATAHQERAELRRKLAATGCVEDVAKLECSIRIRLALAAAGVFEILCAGANAPARDDWTALAASDRRSLADLQPRRRR